MCLLHTIHVHVLVFLNSDRYALLITLSAETLPACKDIDSVNMIYSSQSRFRRPIELH